MNTTKTYLVLTKEQLEVVNGGKLHDNSKIIGPAGSWPIGSFRPSSNWDNAFDAYHDSNSSWTRRH